MIRYEDTMQVISTFISFDKYEGNIYSNINQDKLITKEEFEKEAFEIYSQYGDISISEGIPAWSFGEDFTQIDVTGVICKTMSKIVMMQQAGVTSVELRVGAKNYG